MAVYLLEMHYPSTEEIVRLCVCNLKTGTRRIIRLDELSFLSRRSKRWQETFFSGRRK